MTRLEALIEAIENMNEGDLVALHNEYCDKMNYYDDRIYYMWELDDIFCGCSPLELLAKLDTGFDERCDYFRFDGYGYAESLDDPESYIYIANIAEYIDDTENALYNDEVREVLDTYEEDDEEDEED